MSGSKGLAIGAGAGFIGGAVAGVAAVSMYHQYRQYQSMMYCYSLPGGCYGGGYGKKSITTVQTFWAYLGQKSLNVQVLERKYFVLYNFVGLNFYLLIFSLTC